MNSHETFRRFLSLYKKMGSTVSKPKFNLSKYLGKWYDIAHYPTIFQTDCRNATAEYSIQNGKVKVLNRCRKSNGELDEAIGEGTVVGDGHLKVAFPFAPEGDYLILSTDYDNYSLVAGGDDTFWILSRRPIITAAEKELLLKQMSDLKIDPTPLIWN